MQESIDTELLWKTFENALRIKTWGRNTSSPKTQHTLFLDAITHKIQQQSK